jgi:uncharacterized protein (DUF362 family)
MTIKSVSKITRRDFLKSLSVTLGALALNQALASCSQTTPETQTQPAATATRKRLDPTPGPTTDAPPNPETSPTTEATSAPENTSASEAPDLVVARHGEPEEMVRRAMAALGGMQRFVAKGANVVVKPNICVAYHTYEYAATTNPWVVGALVKLCFEAGASKVQVMDSPFGGTAEEAYAISGIAEQVQAAGGEMVTMPAFKFTAADIPEGQDLKKIKVFDDILKADVVINVPIAKHHSLARLTLGMKNLMGTIQDRQAIHRNMGQRLADLTSRIRPALTVVDAVRILMANGPTGGNLNDVKQMDTIIACPDIVAADSYATTLFDMRPDDLKYIVAANAMGLGSSDLGSLRIEEISVDA